MPQMTLVMIEVTWEPSVLKVSNMQTIWWEMIFQCCRDDVQTCESTICSRNRYRCVWWKPIGVSLFYGCLWWSCQKENSRPMWKTHTSNQIYHWGTKGNGRKLHTTSSKGMISNCKADGAYVVWRSTQSGRSISQRDQAVATDQTRTCWSI